MQDSKSNLATRKSFLSPQHLKYVRTIQSPKFDHKKAQNYQIQRTKFYEQKLTRYAKYNYLLSAKAKKELDLLKTQLQFENTKNGKFKKNQSVKEQQIIKKSKHEQLFEFGILAVPKHQSKQKGLERHRQINHALNTRNTQLKSYLKQLNSGVSQLECILEQVEVTHGSLKKINPEFQGLWILDEDQNDKNQDHIKSENNTKDTVDFQWERKNEFLNTKKQTIQSLKVKNRVICPKNFTNQRLQTINKLERKFKLIVQQISRRDMLANKIENQSRQLSLIEKELDQLKKGYFVKKLNNCKSQKNIQSNLLSQQKHKQIYQYQTLSKVKSLGKIFC